jgi:hypothetical protein
VVLRVKAVWQAAIDCGLLYLRKKHNSWNKASFIGLMCLLDVIWNVLFHSIMKNRRKKIEIRNSDSDLPYHASLSSVDTDFSNLLHKARLEVQIMWELGRSRYLATFNFRWQITSCLTLKKQSRSDPFSFRNKDRGDFGRLIRG